MTQISPQKPITLIGGYLGAGKTTFINKLLNSGRLPSSTAVLVNDFGDINIDEQLIRSGSNSDQVIGLANGCVCCSIADDLTAALEALKSSGIERVLLECSGVAEPQKARLQCHYPGYYPHASVVLVDALNHAQRCTDKYVGALGQRSSQTSGLNRHEQVLRPTLTFN
jgi:G3E family GTPase